jgi:hypothetical protein
MSDCHWPDCRYSGACDYRGHQCGAASTGAFMFRRADVEKLAASRSEKAAS